CTTFVLLLTSPPFSLDVW
nr:immunoglobulin heavy chain junction region [Macaca mulatta]MOY20140.1 immunoglobulin heavy chain junction region [Macaca mulatta]